MITETEITETKTKIQTKTKILKNLGLRIKSLQPALAEIERMIDYLKIDMDFGDIRITPTIQTQGQRKTFGHFSANRWQDDNGSNHHEIQITAENLKRPAMDIASTIRHELVHAKNFSLGIRDASNSGVYHNLKFKSSAEEYGLICAEKTPANGHGFTSLSAMLEARLIAELQPNDSAFNLVRLATKPKKAKTKMLKWSCGCTNIRAAVEVNATCEECSETFIKV